MRALVISQQASVGIGNRQLNESFLQGDLSFPWRRESNGFLYFWIPTFSGMALPLRS